LVLVGAFAAAGFAAVAAAALGASFGESFGESLGESAKAVPVSRNSDSASDASFLIASLFFLQQISNKFPGNAYHPAWEVKWSLLRLYQSNMNSL
jgi:hypothetical protein